MGAQGRGSLSQEPSTREVGIGIGRAIGLGGAGWPSRPFLRHRQLEEGSGGELAEEERRVGETSITIGLPAVAGGAIGPRDGPRVSFSALSPGITIPPGGASDGRPASLRLALPAGAGPGEASISISMALPINLGPALPHERQPLLNPMGNHLNPMGQPPSHPTPSPYVCPEMLKSIDLILSVCSCRGGRK